MLNHLNHFGTHLLLGKVKGSNAPVWYPINEMTKHILILGRTGSGKTNNIFWIIAYLLMSGISVWCFDFKRDFRHLTKLFSDKLLVIDVVKDLKCNPLFVPPLIDPRYWRDSFIDMFCKVFRLLEGSRGLLSKILNKAYQRFGVYDGKEQYPTYKDILRDIKNYKTGSYSRTSGYKDSLINRFETCLTHEEIYDCSKGFDIDKLTRKSIVFELSSINEEHAIFWINYFLLWVFTTRLMRNQRSNSLNLEIILDECKNIYSPFENNALGFDFIVKMTSMLREFQVGILASDQSAYLNNSIYANTQLKVLYPLGSGDDILKAKIALGLNDEQIDYIHRLGVGEAIVRYHKIKDPFIIQVPKFPLE